MRLLIRVAFVIYLLRFTFATMPVTNSGPTVVVARRDTSGAVAKVSIKLIK